MKIRYGWIQISPADLGRRVFVQIMHYPLVMAWKNQKTYGYIQLTRQLIGLSADANLGTSVNFAGTVWEKTLHDGSKVEYYMDSGDVMIKSITLKDAKLRQSALRQVEYQPISKSWVTNEDILARMDHSHTWTADIRTPGGIERSSAHYAAVSGIYSDPVDAGFKLGRHITGAYGEQCRQFHPEAAEKRGNHYSLLYINKGDHTNKLGPQMLAQIIEQNATANARVHTVVQGLSAKTFITATAKLKGRSANKDGLAKQQFYFSNPEGVGKEELKAACESLGVTFAGVRNNPYDLYQAGRNAIGELYAMECNMKNAMRALSATGKALNQGAQFAGKVVQAGVGGGAMAGGMGLFDDVTKIGSSTNAVETISGLIEAVGNSPMAKMALLGCGALILLGQGSSLHKHYMTMYRDAKTTSKSTFGAGNQFWFDNKKSFQSALA